MVNKDWRITNQKKYLTNVELIKANTNQICSEHEHCVFCWDKFLKNEEIKIELYATLDLKHWICEKCFNDFKKEFNWTIAKADNVNNSKQA